MIGIGPNHKLQRALEAARPRLFRLAWSWCHDDQLADDLVQDALEKALRHSAQLRDSQRLVGWLSRILVNLFRDHHRRRRDQIAVDDGLEWNGDNPELEAQRADLAARTRRAMEQLSVEHRQVLTLVDVMELSYIEAAEALDVPVGTVMSRLARARARLRNLLSEIQESPRRGNAGLRVVR